MEYSKESINESIISWVELNLTNFHFRQYQKEAIIDIIYNILNPEEDQENHCQIIEAPTGSGKSLINIISACVLADIYDKRSYILASDLYLWQQYYDFIVENPILNEKIGCLKGQIGNYTCRRNQQDLSKAECKIAGLSWATLYSNESAKSRGFDCARNCKYIKDRRKALKTKVTLLTYQLYFMMVDGSNNDDKVPVFDCRDIVFCDECHNIPSIVQLKYSPSIHYSYADHIYNIYNYSMSNELSLFNDLKDIMLSENLIDKFKSQKDIENEWNEIWNITKIYKNTSEQDYNNLYDIYNFFNQFIQTIENIKDSIMENIKNHSIVTKQDIEIYNECNIVENYLNSIIELLTIIQICGKQYLVKQINEKDNTIESITYHCAKEDYMVFTSLLNKTKNKVLISATVGDQDTYEDNIGIKYFGMKVPDVGTLSEIAQRKGLNKEELTLLDRMIQIRDEASIYKRIPSTFDFSKSPIHFLNKYNMGFRNRKDSLERLKPIIYKLCEQQFKGVKGMIQTGSYQIAKEIIDNAPYNIKSRFLYYSGSREKIDNITIHKMSKDTILIGPTLNEGIDLPGDNCRFIIILKVPFPQLKDRLVESKINLFPNWYNYITSNQIIQGIGRGNRFKEDWCITYILDSCFFNLYMSTKDQYPKEIQDRIKIYN